MSRPKTPMRIIFELILVIFVLVCISAVLLPSLSRSRELAKRAVLSREYGDYGQTAPYAGLAQATDPGRAPPVAATLAQVRSFKAKIELKPRVSVGTEKPESIYEVSFSGEIEALNPTQVGGRCEIHLPLPPQIISLSDLLVKIDGEPSDDVEMRNDRLVWHGALPAGKPTPVTVAYSAVGKGIFTLNTPPGKIIDSFQATLTARQTDLKMLELSLQPNTTQRVSGDTVYEWKYARLMYGRPIAVDVLGIAPMDKLGELAWLGPVSVTIFGVLLGLFVMATAAAQMDKWMLLLMIGAFAAAYPLMYFAQEFMSLGAAMVCSAALVVAIIAARAVTLLGVRAAAGIVLLTAATFLLTLWAAVDQSKQGLLGTIMGIGTFVLAMVLLPKAQKAMAALAPAPSAVPPAPQAGRPQTGAPPPTPEF